MPTFVNDHFEYVLNGIKYKGYMISDSGKLPYFLVVPDNLANDTQMVVESLNKENDGNGDVVGFGYTAQECSSLQIGDILKDSTIFSCINTTKRILQSVSNAPVVIPIVPSISGEGYYQELSRDCLEGKSKDERIDTQYLECIESAKKKIEEISGSKVADKVFLNGYSASGVFAQRFALIHPEIVSKCCVGGAVGSIPIPEDKLPYPCGIKDFEELFGKEFDEESYKQIDFAYYVGEHEASRPGNYGKDGKPVYIEVPNLNGKVDLKRNDTSVPIMPMHDMSYHPRSMNVEIGKEFREAYGETMQDRLDSAIEYYTKNGYIFKSKIFRDVAHNNVEYRSIGELSQNNKRVKYFGIFSVPNGELGDGVPQRIFQDISDFYREGTGFEPDDKSVSRLDMTEQEHREADAKRHSKTKLEQLNDEQDSLTQILDNKKKEYEQIKNQVRGKGTYEKTE